MHHAPESEVDMFHAILLFASVAATGLVSIVLLVVSIQAIFSQSPIDVPNSAGWVSTGLLSAVLSWVLGKMIPDMHAMFERLIRQKDDQATQLRESEDKKTAMLLEHHRGAVVSISNDNREATKALAAEMRTVIQETANHCDKEIDRLMRFIDAKEKQIATVTGLPPATVSNSKV